MESSCGKPYALPLCSVCKKQYAHMSWYRLNICNLCLQDEQQTRYNPKSMQLWMSMVEPAHRDIEYERG